MDFAVLIKHIEGYWIIVNDSYNLLLKTLCQYVY